MLDVKRILCPTDFSEASNRGLEYGVSIAEGLGAEIYLVNVVPAVPHLAPSRSYSFDVPEYEGYLRQDAQKHLSELAETIRGVKVHPILEQGDSAEGILRAAESNKVDLIVMATAGHTGWDRVLFGSVAEKVVRRANCPVLTVRRP
jgi:nucleotide-binding universal stress UspA family protein